MRCNRSGETDPGHVRAPTAHAETDRAEAEQHHRPGCGFRHCCRGYPHPELPNVLDSGTVGKRHRDALESAIERIEEVLTIRAKIIQRRHLTVAVATGEGEEDIAVGKRVDVKLQGADQTIIKGEGQGIVEDPVGGTDAGCPTGGQG